MANSSDVLLSKLETISWMYSIDCQIHGKDTTLLIKYIIEEDFYAVMVTDLTQTYFECLEGKDIDDHYRRFNKGEVKRERLVHHLKSLLADVTKANEWHFETLLVDCHTSRLTLKVKNQMTILKFDWSFYMISTNPETLSRHLTLPLLRLVSSLKHGVDVLKKDIKAKDKLLEQTETNAKIDTFSDDSLVNKMVTFQRNSQLGSDDNSLLLSLLIKDQMINSVLRNAEIDDKGLDNSTNTAKNNCQTNVKQNDDQIANQSHLSKSKELVSQTSPDTRKKSPTRQSKKLKL
ncbi:unnamed protein product [Medioppia subpectinata]|uniref:Non-homologous end-joining factor 1 n=1 Tax=Medioppia subpectinata TaxID=1979941 RepID=A0A7R9PVE0_9ACAR|nr:unnamed protein product [Medioppia subpectinata]CAG2102188.1 unnamed protein product [Medioppia subpectinata]